MKISHHPILLTLAGATVLAALGCNSIGPASVSRDRFDYSSSIAESWKKQTLLNIVKLRYFDLPVFVDVSSIVAGYSLQTGATVSGNLSANSANELSAEGEAIFIDRPTITYTPLTGQKFLRGLLTPISPKDIFFMLQSGYPADFVLGLTLESLNGLHNRSAVAGFPRAADPEFIRVLRLLREVQAASAIGMKVQENKDKTETIVMFFRQDHLPQEILDKLKEIRRLLRMPEEQQQFNLVYSPTAGAANELTVSSRSMLQIMQVMSSYTEVRAADLAEGRAVPLLESTPPDTADSVRIKCSTGRPDSAFAMVQYRNQWFWVDDRDLRTKRAFSAIMFLFTMAESSGDEKLPLITIPAQ